MYGSCRKIVCIRGISLDEQLKGLTILFLIDNLIKTKWYYMCYMHEAQVNIYLRICRIAEAYALELLKDKETFLITGIAQFFEGIFCETFYSVVV